MDCKNWVAIWTRDLETESCIKQKGMFVSSEAQGCLKDVGKKDKLDECEHQRPSSPLDIALTISSFFTSIMPPLTPPVLLNPTHPSIPSPPFPARLTPPFDQTKQLSTRVYPDELAFGMWVSLALDEGDIKCDRLG